jgi:DNA polymerase/3'-5' exonuclease PolX
MKDEKFMGIAHCPSGKYFYFHVDIVFLPKEEWGSGLLWFTGSKVFNINMRARAKKMGYTLNQKGLFDQNGDQIKAFTEKEIMYALKMNWTLNQKGLFDQNGDQIKAFTEKEIMYALKMNWVPPEKR